MLIGVLNLAMYHTPTEPGEHIQWNVPDYFKQEDFEWAVGCFVEDYVEENPYMLIFEVEAN